MIFFLWLCFCFMVGVVTSAIIENKWISIITCFIIVFSFYPFVSPYFFKENYDEAV